jgi:hypothetical protein
MATTEQEAALAHFEEVWSDGMLHEHIGEKLTCGEVEALAGALRALGAEEETLDYLIQAHAYGDEEGDLHYEGGESS